MPAVAAEIHFGTDGWRAVVGDDFTYENVRAVAQGVAAYLEGESRPVVVGHDARYCAELFAREVARVLAANGLQRAAPRPRHADPGGVVDGGRAGAPPGALWSRPATTRWSSTASSTSPTSAVRRRRRWSPSWRRTRVKALSKGVKTMPFDEAVSAGGARLIDPLPSYCAQLGRMVDLDRLRNAGLRVAHEAMYGAGAGLIARVLDGRQHHGHRAARRSQPRLRGHAPRAHRPLHAGGDGADGRAVSTTCCVANDGDADRVGIIDETGRYVNQLEVMALFAMYLLEKRGERGDIVRSLTTTNMVDALGERFGVKVHEMPVGFKYIGATMRETDALLGGEESGGFAFRGHIPERDGILAGLMIADMIVEYGQPLSEILEHLFELVGPHAYRRDDIRFDRDGYEKRKSDVYKRMEKDAPKELAGEDGGPHPHR